MLDPDPMAGALGAIGSMAQASMREPRLVVVREARCCVCGRLIAGEARRWATTMHVHLACASELGGPGGR